MSELPKDYLKYSKRGYGQDHDYYEWRLSKDRPRLQWDGGAKVAICYIVPLEFFPLNPSGVPFKHPGSMVTPYPDLRHFTVRDYGNRVGVFRILEAFNNTCVNATIAMNAELARQYPPLLKTIEASTHELAAHGYHTDAIHHDGLSRQTEYDLIHDTFEWIPPEAHGWMSPARNQSSTTLELLAEWNLRYCLDWEMDQVPVTARTKNGDLTLIPNSYELSDFTLLHTRRQTEESWLEQIMNAIDLLADEYDRFGSQMLGLTLTPYIIGQPFRIWALRELLIHINDRDDVSIFTAGDIDRQFRTQTK